VQDKKRGPAARFHSISASFVVAEFDKGRVSVEKLDDRSHLSSRELLRRKIVG
jgi:hypothetical protein